MLIFSSLSMKNRQTVQLSTKIINRPGVAGAVLQTPLSLIHAFIHSSIKKKKIIGQIGMASSVSGLANG